MISPLQTRYRILLSRASVLSCFSKEILEHSRKVEVIKYRYIIFYILRKDGYSFSEISRVCNKNHATIMHDVDEIEYLINHDKDVKSIYEDMQDNPTFDEKIAEWMSRPEHTDPILTAIHFYNLK